MKCRDLEQHLRKQGCEMIREGARHTVYYKFREWRDVYRAAPS